MLCRLVIIGLGVVEWPQQIQWLNQNTLVWIDGSFWFPVLSHLKITVRQVLSLGITKTALFMLNLPQLTKTVEFPLPINSPIATLETEILKYE